MKFYKNYNSLLFYVIKIISVKEIRAFFKEILQKYETELEGTFTKHEKLVSGTAQKMKFSIKDFFSKCDQIRRHDITTLSTAKAET